MWNIFNHFFGFSYLFIGITLLKFDIKGVVHVYRGRQELNNYPKHAYISKKNKNILVC